MSLTGYSGNCRACGRPLVQIVEPGAVRTYHPAATYSETDGERCPELIPIGLGHYSLDVDESAFVLDESIPPVVG